MTVEDRLEAIERRLGALEGLQSAADARWRRFERLLYLGLTAIFGVQVAL